jgi:hypothetical protein
MTAAVSGSFRQAMTAVQAAVYALTDRGVTVLSPADPRVVDELGDFLFVASDYVRVVRLVQSRHLAAIEASDFLWLVAPEGYVGLSASMEIGFAVARGVPVYSTDVPADLTLRQYVIPVRGIDDAIRHASAATSPQRQTPELLLDPVLVAQTAHDDLDLIARELTGAAPPVDEGRAAEAAARIQHSLSLLR